MRVRLAYVAVLFALGCSGGSDTPEARDATTPQAPFWARGDKQSGGAAAPDARHAVRGRVCFRGQPVAAGSVEFCPADAGAPVVSKLETDGSYFARLPIGDYDVKLSAQIGAATIQRTVPFSVAADTTTFDIDLK